MSWLAVRKRMSDILVHCSAEVQMQYAQLVQTEREQRSELALLDRLIGSLTAMTVSASVWGFVYFVVSFGSLCVVSFGLLCDCVRLSFR